MRYAKHQSILAVCVISVISIMGEESLVCMSVEKAGIYAISEIIEVPRAWKNALIFAIGLRQRNSCLPRFMPSCDLPVSCLIDLCCDRIFLITRC